MAPKRRNVARKAASKPGKTPKEEMEKEDAPVPQPAESFEDSFEDEKSAEAEPSPKKAKLEDKKKPGRKPKAATKKSSASSRKKATDDGENTDEEKVELGDEEAPISKETKKVIVIEASKECNCFKVRAAKVEAGLTKAIPGVEVLINPGKPRKGCFEVRDEDGNVYLSLQGLPRPFTKLKNLDMDKTVTEIVAKVK